MAYDTILETTAVQVVVDDSKLTAALSKATKRVRDAFRRIEKAQSDAAKSGVTATAAQDKALASLQAKVDKLTAKVKEQAAGQRESNKAAKEAAKAAHEAGRAAEKGAKGARDNAKATDTLGDEMKTAARFAMTLRRELENDVIVTEEFKRQANELRDSLLRQAATMDRTSKEYDQAQLGAQRLSTALATVEGRTSKLGISANIATGATAALAARLRAAGPAGNAAALGLTAFAGASNLAGRAARSFGRYIGTQLIPIIATFAGIAGIGLATRALNGFVDASFQAQVQMRLFTREMERSGQALQGGQDALARLAQTFRSTEEDVAAGATQLLRYGATIGQVERLMEAGGASALAFGRTAADGFEAIAQAIVGEQSQILNRIGIAGNLSTAYIRYAKDIGVATDALTREQKVQAAMNLILEETQGEVEALDELLAGFGGARTAFGAQVRLASRALGEEFEPALTAAYEAGAQFLKVFREQVIPLFADRFGPVITGAAESVQGFLDVISDPTASLSGLSADLTEAIGPVVQLTAAFMGLWSGASAAINGVLGEVAYFGAYLGYVSTDWKRFFSSRNDEMVTGLLGEEGARAAGLTTDTTFTDDATAFAEEQRAAFRERRQSALATGDAAWLAFTNPEAWIADVLAGLQSGAAVAAANTPPDRPPLDPNAPGGTGDPDAPGGTPSDPIYTRNLYSDAPDAATRARNSAAAAAIRADTEAAMRANGLLTGGPFTGTGIPRPDRGDGDLFAQRDRLGALEAGRRIASSLADATERGIQEEAARQAREAATSDLSAYQSGLDNLARRGRAAGQRQTTAAERREAEQGLENFGASMENLARAGREASQELRAARLDATAEEAAAARRELNAFTSSLAELARRGREATVANFARRADAVFGGGQSAVAPGGRYAFNDFTTSSGFERAEGRREFEDAVREAADTQRNAGIDFATEVVNAGQGFVSAIEAFRSGNIGGGIAGLGSTAGSLFGSIGSLAGLASAGPIGALIGAGAGLLGGIVGAFTGDNESPAVDSAQSRRMPSAIELTYNNTQNISLGLLDDPATTRKFQEWSDMNFRQFEEIVKNLIPKIEGRVT